MSESTIFLGFLCGLLGAKAGEEREVNFAFPSTPLRRARGWQADFDVKVRIMKDKVLPELDDASVLRVSEVVRSRLRAEG